MDIQTIMIVDDSAADQFLVTHTIKTIDPSIQVLCAGNGSDALKLLSELNEAPDVILLDINMPLMNGFQFLEEYQKHASPTTTILMLTSSDQEKDKERVKDFDYVKGYFLKPFDADDYNFLKSLQ